jgi:hypothetical protein
MSLRCRTRISRPVAHGSLTPVRLHLQVSSESRPPGHWSTHRPAPPKGRGPAVRVTAAMNPLEPWCRLRRRSELVEHICFVRRVLRNVLPGRRHGLRWLVVGPSWSSPSGQSGWPALACDRCRPCPWSSPTDPTMLSMLPCRIWSITPPGWVVWAAPSVEVLAGSAEPPPAPTHTSRLEGGLEVVVATAVHGRLGRGSGRLHRHENGCRCANRQRR